MPKNMIPASLVAALPGLLYLSNLQSLVIQWHCLKKNNSLFIEFAANI